MDMEVERDDLISVSDVQCRKMQACTLAIKWQRPFIFGSQLQSLVKQYTPTHKTAE